MYGDRRTVHLRAADVVPEPVTLALLRPAVGGSGPASDETARRLLATSTVWVLERDAPVAVVAGGPSEEGWTIRAIAVAQDCRRQGLGRDLIDRLSHLVGGPWLLAETDSDGVGFYRRCGIEVVSLGEKYPGVERFSCRRRV
ncbi:GNAT family N-acetyltransferase [Ruania alba]|nr:GNAT family N-acetyltransferase [Ruania alba]